MRQGARRGFEASMGPRLISRGEAAIEGAVDEAVKASMGPRLISRGECYSPPPAPPLPPASMGPRLISRGEAYTTAGIATYAELQWGHG